jgi:hypothetical protein
VIAPATGAVQHGVEFATAGNDPQLTAHTTNTINPA